MLTRAKVIDYKDPAEFTTRRAIIERKSGIPDTTLDYNITFEDRDLTFSQMREYRGPISPLRIKNNLDNGGHIFANLGVGATLTLDLKGEAYLLGVRQNRVECGDIVFNPVGGYVHTAHLTNPLKAAEEEIAEEVLPIAQDGRLFRFGDRRKIISRPFAKHFQDAGVIDITTARRYLPPNLSYNVRINDDNIEEIPGILFESTRNSAKLVFNYHLQPPEDLQSLGVSLHSSEDQPPRKVEHAGAFLMPVQFNPNSIWLIQLKDGELTDRVYTMQNGSLRPVDPSEVYVSEVFLADQDSIANKNKMRLEDFLESQ